MTKGPNRQSSVKASPESLAAGARAAGTGGLPPVEEWDPPFCGDLDMEIRRDGSWFYLGTPIGRPELVRLFSTILKREDNAYFLVTPVEKVGIRVQDAPFVAVDFSREGSTLVFTTNVGERVPAGTDHPIRVAREAATGQPAPYLLVRRNLEALIDRKSFYRLVEIGQHAEHEGESWFGLRSGGVFFPVIPSVELSA